MVLPIPFFYISASLRAHCLSDPLLSQPLVAYLLYLHKISRTYFSEKYNNALTYFLSKCILRPSSLLTMIISLRINFSKFKWLHFLFKKKTLWLFFFKFLFINKLSFLRPFSNTLTLKNTYIKIIYINMSFWGKRGSQQNPSSLGLCVNCEKTIWSEWFKH